ncbi:class I SAM-dependent methyltransferase [Pandoraea sp. PE-S2T-3]|uniref:class I SAM-dependent methyltransferase n=1 Tax=Pandoraea sp. PE-S2T-3 TaxID=1986993 RepID=UPI000B4059FD|nr:class I SAM-dependent methyltransferase [Pandoraea sp. PE-S2T-3]
MNDKIDRQREHFNQISDKYSAARKGSNHLLLKKLIWTHFFSDKQSSVASGARLLEPMCGMAEGLAIVRNYVQPNVDYYGFDYSDNMVALAREQHPGLRIEWQDATRFDPKGETFDFIILIGGLHHVFEQSAEVVARLCAALAPGGVFVTFEPTQNTWLTRKVRERIYQKNDLFDEQTEQGFDLPDLDAMFEQVGMQRVDQVYPGLLAYVLYYNPDAFPLLNRGGTLAVRATFALDRLFWRNWIGRKLSFATITMWRKP